MPIHRKAPAYEDQMGGNEVLETGIKVIDYGYPFARGGKVGLFGGAGVGKTVTVLELIEISQSSTQVCPYLLVWVSAHGERLLRDGRSGCTR